MSSSISTETGTSPSRALSPPSPAQLPTSEILERLIERYGDIVYDLCDSVLVGPGYAHLAFRFVLKDLRKAIKQGVYDTYERPWVLKIACTRVLTLATRHARTLSSTEQKDLVAERLNVPSRLKRFDTYFCRLSTHDRVLLLLRDKYGLPYPEISVALSLPEGSLKVRRQQALRSLEEWIWEA